MFLYHYSKEIRSALLTKEKSGVMTPIQIKLEKLEARRRPWNSPPYCQHISFFFEPIPAKLLPELFGVEHPVWYPGNKLYEHIVKVEDFPTTITYEVVESLKKTALYDQFSEENNWVDDDPELLEKWMILIDVKAREWGEKGNKRSVLEQKIKENTGSIAENFRNAVAREDFEWNRKKYAANVPHLMLYPPTGRVAVHQIKGVTMGSDQRRSVISTAALR